MNGKIVSVDEAIKLLTEYKKNGGENVLFSSFDLDSRSPDCEAIPISITHGIKAISTGFPIMYDRNIIVSSLKTHDKKQRKNYSICGEGNQKIGIKISKNYRLISYTKVVTYKHKQW